MDLHLGVGTTATFDSVAACFFSYSVIEVVNILRASFPWLTEDQLLKLLKGSSKMAGELYVEEPDWMYWLDQQLWFNLTFKSACGVFQIVNTKTVDYAFKAPVDSWATTLRKRELDIPLDDEKVPQDALAMLTLAEKEVSKGYDEYVEATLKRIYKYLPEDYYFIHGRYNAHQLAEGWIVRRLYPEDMPVFWESITNKLQIALKASTA